MKKIRKEKIFNKVINVFMLIVIMFSQFSSFGAAFAEEVPNIENNEVQTEQSIPPIEKADQTVNPSITRTDKIAKLGVDVAVDKNNPPSGDYFNLILTFGGMSYGTDNTVYNAVATIPLSSSDKLEAGTLPTDPNGEYTCSIEGNNIVIRFAEFQAGGNYDVKIPVKFKEGVSLPSEILSGQVTFTGDNADDADAASIPEVSPYNTAKPVYMNIIDQVSTFKAYIPHSAQINLTPELKEGGLNVANGKLKVDFPADIVLNGLNFKGQNLDLSTVKANPDGTKYILLDVSPFDVDKSNFSGLTIDYNYPKLKDGDLPDGVNEKNYEIKATFTGTRYNGEEFTEAGTIKEKQTLYKGAGVLGKTATEEIYKKADQSIEYSVNYTSGSETKNMVIIDDPYKETDFFKGYNYTDFNWNSTLNNIDSQFSYQTNKNSSWQVVGDPSKNGSVTVSSLNLASDEYVTLVKLDLSYGGSKVIPANSGDVIFKLNGKTTENITDTTLSTNNNIVNTAKFSGEYLDGDSYVEINKEYDATTVYIPEVQGAYPGWEGWGQPFYNKDSVTSQNTFAVGDTFSYKNTPANVGWAGGNIAIEDPVVYVKYPNTLNIDPEKVTIKGYEDGVFKTKPTVEIIPSDGGYNLVKISINESMPATTYDSKYQVIIRDIEPTSRTGSAVDFTAFLGSNNPNQKYVAGVGWRGATGMPWANYAVAIQQWATFDSSLKFSSEIKVSTGGTNEEDFSFVNSLVNQNGGKNVIFRLSAENIGTNPTNQTELISMLPYKNDTVTTNDVSKNSTISGYLKGLSIDDGSGISGVNFDEYEIYVSKDATAANNKKDLKNTGVSGYSSNSTWEPWDGATELTDDYRAIKIVKKSGLGIGEGIKVYMDYHVPEITTNTESLWASVALGGYYKSGNNKFNIAVTEPRKAGLMVGNDAVKSLNGYAWEDSNWDGIRNDSEPVIPNYPVYLVNENNDIIDQTTTDVNGYYEFTQLFAGKYRVIMQNDRYDAGWDLTKNLELNDNNVNDMKPMSDKSVIYDYAPWLSDKKGGYLGITDTIDLTPENIIKVDNIDGGYVDKSSANNSVAISGNVWLDTAINGIWQTTLEDTYPEGTTMNLYKKEADGTYAFVKATVTDNNGYYEFSGPDLTSGDYVVGLKEMPASYKRTVNGSSMKFDDRSDTTSQGIDAPYVTAEFHVNDGQRSENWDLGLIETVDLYVTKIWEDGGNTSKRPENIVVELKKDGKAFNQDGSTDPYEIVKSTDGTWETLEIKGLEKYHMSNAKAVENKYTVNEKDVPSGYTMTQTDKSDPNEKNTYRYEITNKLDKTTIEGTKSWDDANDQDGKRPNSITVNLLADGKKVDSKTVSEANGWKYSFSDLEIYKDDGTEISYTINEEAVADYTPTVTGTNLTNTHTPEKTTVEGTKTWDDANDQDGKRPESINVNLLADGTKIDSKTVSATEDWRYSFTNLDKYKDGKAISYTITEDTVTNYTTKITGANITNSYTPGKTSVTVTKAWDDNNDQDGLRPEKISVQLYADGVKSGAPEELSSGNNWTTTWVDLAQKQNKKDVSYTVKEEGTVTGYTTAVDDTDKGNVIITNSHTPEKTTVEGTKTWDDANDQDGKRPESIVVNLLADGTKKDSKTVSATEDWKYSFTNLDKYKDGKAISYTITEDTVTDYTPKVTGSDITNSYTPGKTSVTVTKAWDDNNDQDGLRPEKISVQLYADGVKSGAPEELNSDNNWTTTWVDLAQKQNKKDVSYTVKEEGTVTGYTPVVDDTDKGNVIITNSHTPEKTTVEGTKTWDDANDQDGKRPESIKVNLLANGTKVDSKTVSAKEDWKYSFANIDKYKDGSKILYTITEDTVTDYTPTVTGTDITNSYTPGKTSVTVTKAWNDKNDQDGLRPDKISVQLYADGVKTGNPEELNSGNKWTTTWKDLDQRRDGKDITYTVKEIDDVPGYTTVIDDSDKGNIIITNSHTPKVITTTNNPTSSGKSFLSKILPNTGENYNYLFSILGTLIVLMAVVLFFIRKLRKLNR
ncbi:Cna B-type domain-containing protein [Enterococcus alishanensis]